MQTHQVFHPNFALDRRSAGRSPARNHAFRWRSALENAPSETLILIHERSKLDGVDEKLRQLPGFIRSLVAAAIDHVPSVFFGPEAALATGGKPPVILITRDAGIFRALLPCGGQSVRQMTQNKKTAGQGE
jgi:hypothetical protein